MDVKTKRWKQQSFSQRAGQDSSSDIAWKRSGDEGAWNRPPHAARPQSCLEGKLKDEWLQQFSNLQTNELPHYLQKNLSLSESRSSVTSSQSSLESLYSGLESKERVQIKTGPKTERASVCCFAPVRIGWLPLQRQMVMPERVNNNFQQDETTCKVKLKPPITPVLSCSFVKAKGSEIGEGTSGREVVRGISGAIALQADSKRKTTHAERDQDTALERATSVWNTSRDRLLWQTPVHRRRSIPQVAPHIPPTTGGRTSPKHSGSISSITITSKKVMRSSSLPDTSLFGHYRGKESSSMESNNHIVKPDYMNTLSPTKVVPQRKALVIKITEQKVNTSRFLQPGATIGPVYGLTSSRTSEEHYFSPFSTQESSDPTATNLSRVKYRPFPSSLNVTGRDNDIPQSDSQVLSCPATQEPRIQVVLQGEATINKVQKKGNTFSRDDMNHRRKVAHRHSFSGLELPDTKPQLDNEHMLSKCEMQVSGSKTKLFKSAISLQLTSANGAHVSYPHTSRGFKPQRPSSCYASLFSPVESKANGSQDALVHSTVLPHETNIDPACSAARSVSRCCSSEEEAGSHDKIYPRTESSVSDKGQNKRESAQRRNQPLTLIKVPDWSTHEVHDAIVAKNAAAIIANIKLQSEQKKKTQSSGNANGEKLSASSGLALVNPPRSGSDQRLTGSMASGDQLVLSALLLALVLAVCSSDSLHEEANTVNQLGPSGKVDRYGSTEPWLLIGGKKRPISLLQTMDFAPGPAGFIRHRYTVVGLA
ncbi:hypothetical protein Baya_3884 [Bagarius yarrelli]|uniref:Uncharacterized protein n=1 Tax=Bagarius yarrelli TaxID=175774 RepID=A0A556TWU6_BAGYA|nr:hypothetical protein Baya_3884 [Bagarius yarrelli]